MGKRLFFHRRFYARIGRFSDVYVWKWEDRWYCHCCSPRPFKSLRELRAHLMWHIRRGDKVPDSCMDRIRREMLFEEI